MRKVEHPKKRKPHQKKVRLDDVDNVKDLDRFSEQNRPLQDYLGFSDEKLGMLYRNAALLLRDQQYQEAKEAFNLLTRFNPYICDFWIGLGMTYQALGDYSIAMSDFAMAIALNPNEVEPYWCAIDCCLEAKDYDTAKAIVKDAMHYIRKHHGSSKAKALQQEIKKLRERISREESEQNRDVIPWL